MSPKKRQHLYSTLPYLTLPYPTLPYLITTLKLPYLTLYCPTFPYSTLPYPDPYPSLNLVPYSTLPSLTLLYSTFTVCSTLHYAFLSYATNTSTLPYPSSTLPYPKIVDVFLTHTVSVFFMCLCVILFYYMCKGVSGERLEVDPVSQNKSGFFARPAKPVSLHNHHVFVCYIHYTHTCTHKLYMWSTVKILYQRQTGQQLTALEGRPTHNTLFSRQNTLPTELPGQLHRKGCL